MSFETFPSILLVHKRPEIFAVKEVIACEKLHGSCFRVHFPLGLTGIDQIQYGSRETESTDPAFPLGGAVRWFKSRPDLLTNMSDVLHSYNFTDVTIFGEAFGPGVNAKGVKYSNGQDTLFRAFAIMVGTSFITYDTFIEVVDKMGLPRVPEVWRGPPSQEAFDALLEKPSVTAKAEGVDDPNNLAEGVVLQSNPLFRTSWGEWLFAKHKAKNFKEVAEGPKEKLRADTSAIDAFVMTFVTKGRVTNAVGRLQDRGTSLKNDMSDMRVLLAEVLADLKKECASEMEAALDGKPEKLLSGALSKVLGPIYRDMTGGSNG